MTSQPPRLIRAFATVGGWTMFSRLLGFARDVLIAAALGSGPVAQAFVIAFTLPNLFRRFFAEGAFNMAFVPMFAKRLEGEGHGAARAFGEEAMAALGSILIVFTLLAQLAMPWLVLALASGFAGDERFALSVAFGRIAFPYILFISLAALMSGVLNSLGRFAAAAAAGAVLNTVLIAAIGLAHLGIFGAMEAPGAPENLAGMRYGTVLVWAVVVAGVAQFALVWEAARRGGMTLMPRLPKVTPAVKRLAIIALPAALAGGVVQINLVVGRQVASYFEGAVAWLYYADRLYQLPLGVVGVAIGVVLLPDLSRRLRAGDHAGGRESVNRAAEFALVLTLPATVGLLVLPHALTAVLFGRGAFGPEDVNATAWAVAIYGAGLPAFVLQKVLQPMFFAREDTRSPFRFALWGMAVNAIVAVGLAPVLGYLAAALATTAAGWANLWMLWRGARRFGEEARIDDRLRDRGWRILAASLVMGVAALGLATALSDALATPLWRYAALAGVVVAAAAVYAVAAVKLGAFRPIEFRAAFRGR